MLTLKVEMIVTKEEIMAEVLRFGLYSWKDGANRQKASDMTNAQLVKITKLVEDNWHDATIY